jgi:hypothetical protein
MPRHARRKPKERLLAAGRPQQRRPPKTHRRASERRFGQPFRNQKKRPARPGRPGLTPDPCPCPEPRQRLAHAVASRYPARRPILAARSSHAALCEILEFRTK